MRDRGCPQRHADQASYSRRHDGLRCFCRVSDCPRTRSHSRPCTRRSLTIKSTDKSFLALLVSGLTASLALTHHGLMHNLGAPGYRKQTVLVTAAAGGAGQIAVQLAKLNGHTVIGTCSTGKQGFLTSIGCDRGTYAFVFDR